LTKIDPFRTLLLIIAVSFVLLQSYEVPVNNGVVLCRIFLKKRDDGKNEEDQVQDRVAKKPRISRPVFYDFMKTTLPQITDHNKPADLIFLG
jgi:hypothetical protein